MQAKRRPFPTFVLWLLVLALSLLAILLRCLSFLSPNGPPEIAVAAEGNQLGWARRTEVWNGTVYEEEQPFLAYGRELVTPAQAAAGEAVSITVSPVPDEVTVKEYALGSDGSSPYGSAEFLRDYAFYFTGKSGTFTLPEPGEYPVRGYVLRCVWGENRCEYDLVIQIIPE